MTFFRLHHACPHPRCVRDVTVSIKVLDPFSPNHVVDKEFRFFFFLSAFFNTWGFEGIEELAFETKHALKRVCRCCTGLQRITTQITCVNCRKNWANEGKPETTGREKMKEGGDEQRELRRNGNAEEKLPS